MKRSRNMNQKNNTIKEEGYFKYALDIDGSDNPLLLLINISKKDYKLVEPGLNADSKQIDSFVNFIYNQNNDGLIEYVADEKDVYHKCNVIFNNICYCANNVVIYLKDKIYCGEVVSEKFDNKQYLLVDDYIVNFSSNVMLCISNANDSFIDSISGHESLELSFSDAKEKILEIKYHNKSSVFITIDSNNRMISLVDPNISYIPDQYLPYNIYMQKIELRSAFNIGVGFMFNNIYLEKLYAPLASEIEDGCCYSNLNMRYINLDSAKKIGVDFFVSNVNCLGFSLKNLIEIEDNFAYSNEEATYLIAPSCNVVKARCMPHNTKLNLIALSKLKTVGDDSFKGVINSKRNDLPNHYYIAGSLYNNLNDGLNDIEKKSKKNKLRKKK